MKVIHVPFCFYPDAVGGTEVYVAALAHHLKVQGTETLIAAPGKQTALYEHDGLRVRRFAVKEEINDLRELYDEGDAEGAQHFAEILDEEQPDIVHLHALTRGVSLRFVREARQRGIKSVFTYHTPTVSCQRGTLLRWGSEVCDGKLDIKTCTECVLQGLGMGFTGSRLLSHAPSFVGKLVGASHLKNSAGTALRMTELMGLRHATFYSLMNEVNAVVALCRWSKDLLIGNNVPVEKITVSRHGLPVESADSHVRPAISPLSNGALRIAFLGRLDREKGPDLLIRALRSLPEEKIELHLYGITQSDSAFLRELQSLAEGDARIRFCPPIQSEQVVGLLRNYDVLAVPSRCLETGPLVVLEAFAAGVPVIGANLGGISELVEHEVDGLLVEPDSVKDWAEIIKRCCRTSNLIERLRRGVRPPRRMDEAAREMLALYENILRTNPSSQSFERAEKEAHAFG